MTVTGDAALDRALFSAGLSLAVTLLLRRLEARPRVKWFVRHPFGFYLGPTEQEREGLVVYVGAVKVENTGRKEATDVEIHHTTKPQHFKIWPSMDYTESLNPEGFHIIRLKNLGPRESVSIETLSVREQLPITTRVRSSTGVAQRVETQQIIVPPKWQFVVIFGLMFLGASAVFYALLTLMAKFA